MEELQVDSCSICLESLSSPDGGDPSRTPCNHRFHQNCLKEWFIKGFPGSWCPLCKRQLHPVERFDALFGGGTYSDQRSAEGLQTLLEQRTAEEMERYQTAGRRLRETNSNCKLGLQRYAESLQLFNEVGDQLVAGYIRLGDSLEWLGKDLKELENAMEQNKRQGTTASEQDATQQVVTRRRRNYERNRKRQQDEKEQVENLKRRQVDVRKQLDEDNKLMMEQGRNLAEKTRRFELAVRRFEIARRILIQS